MQHALAALHDGPAGRLKGEYVDVPETLYGRDPGRAGEVVELLRALLADLRADGLEDL